MKAEVQKRLENSLFPLIESLSGKQVKGPYVEKPKISSFGDFSTNLAMVYAGECNMKPRDLAKKLRDSLIDQDEEGFFDRVEVAGPGFLNFFLSKSSIWRLYDRLIGDDSLFQFPSEKAPEILVEFVSANPTGPLHVGHGRGAAVGDSLVRLLGFTGKSVKAEYYINDVGNQMIILGESLYLRYLEERGRRVELSDDHYRGEYLKEIAKEISLEFGDKFLDSGDEEREFFSEYAKDRIIKGIKDDLERFNVKFDCWFSEKSLHEAGTVDRAIGILKEKGAVYEKDGALWFKSSMHGDDKDRVLVRANGQKTYFASDIAYHLDKEERGYKELIDIWGADHHGYVQRLASAMGSITCRTGALKILLVQFVTLLKDGEAISMSTRAGRFETLRDVVDDVGPDAARFFYLMRNTTSHLDFDLDLAKRTSSENPVYYVQYAHARICSILREAKEKGLKLPENISVFGLEEDEEMGMMKKAIEFRETVIEAADKLEPHRIPFFLMELAKHFHSYYNRFRFIGDDEEHSMRRISMATGIKKVLSKGLYLIGVSAPERM